jgi:hypothetical protein
MGQTVTKKSECKNLDIIEEALIEIYGWDKSWIKKVSSEEEAKGKSLNHETSLFGGVKGNLPVVLKVDKKNLINKEGKKAVWSDFAVCRTPDGKLEVQTDEHNFDRADADVFVTDEMINEINLKYVQKAQDKHQKKIPGLVVKKNWTDTGEYIETRVAVPESVIKEGRIPLNNYL